MKITVFIDIALQNFVRITETSTYFYETIWYYKGESCHIGTHRRENLKSHVL
jgi:hypothetical protein